MLRHFQVGGSSTLVLYVFFLPVYIFILVYACLLPTTIYICHYLSFILFLYVPYMPFLYFYFLPTYTHTCMYMYMYIVCYFLLWIRLLRSFGFWIYFGFVGLVLSLPLEQDGTGQGQDFNMHSSPLHLFSMPFSIPSIYFSKHMPGTAH